MMRRIILTIPKDLLEKFDEKVKEQNYKRVELIRHLVREYLKKYEKSV